MELKLRKTENFFLGVSLDFSTKVFELGLCFFAVAVVFNDKRRRN